MTRQMFADDCGDMPIFSGTPQRAPAPQKISNEPQNRQTRFAECPICLDTGIVQVRSKGQPRRCFCAIGQQTQVRDALLAQTSKRLARVQHNAPNAYPEMQSDPPDDTEHVLREATALDSPAMRFQTLGVLSLSVVELLSIVLDEQTPVLASRILTQFPTLSRMMSCTPHFLQTIKGMTPRRVMRLQAALQLGYHKTDRAELRPMIKNPADIAELVGASMRGLEQEQMRVLALDTKNHILANVLAYQGSLHTTVIRVSELFRHAMMVNAAAIVVIHNHPSGDATPSPEDVAVTREIVQAGKLLDIDVLDHLVIGDPGFVSLKERGLGFG